MDKVTFNNAFEMHTNDIMIIIMKNKYANSTSPTIYVNNIHNHCQKYVNSA